MAPYNKGGADNRASDRVRHPNGTPAARSSKHRGFRAADSSQPRQKQRWDAEERRGRASQGERPARPNWEPRDSGGQRRPDRDDRGVRGYNRDAPYSHGRPDAPQAPRRAGTGSQGPSAPRRFDRDDRAPRRDNDDRPRRSFDRDDRAPRSFNRDDRAPRRDNDDRPRRFDRDDRAPRSFNRDDRAPRRDNDDRPRRFDRDDRAPRSFNRDDRAPRRDNDDRPRRFDRDDRAPRSFNRDDRAPRRDNDDRPRRFDRDDRAPRKFNRDDRAPRKFDRDDRAPRKFDRDDRSDRAPRRSFDEPERGKFVPADDVKLEKLQAEATIAADVEGVTFGDLGIGGNISRALQELGASSPFPIQAATIPDVLAGKDVLGRGRTGSGKTIAFGAPLVEKLMEHGGGTKRKMGRAPRALILAPTRELALQIDRTVQPIARSVGLFTTQIYGGVPYGRQEGALERGVDIIVGTPGRVQDLMNKGKLDLSEVIISVLDEADHMCDLGFLEPVQEILSATAEVTPQGNRAQKLLFSATLDTQVAALVEQFLHEPSVHEVAGEDQASSTIDHRVLVVEQREKDRLLEELVAGDGKTIVFARTRAYAERLADQFEDAGIRATSLHGDLNQSRRTRNLQLLTSGRVNVLVATDVAARGIHVDDVSLVVQADAPDDYKAYMHRSGRTGRAGKEGTVVTIVPRGRIRKIEGILERAEIEADLVQAAPGDGIVSELAAR
ncbi:DEAD/DEAH box helicase [Curtobacterium flaccumfaciens]|uniref:DEAD/DEAH box helicase n=1 Tax=Curtobacterium flaccumfaciens TaxID=2035 RepID=UPI001BDEE6B5|nr:DEAD/DEAH box helicase [Curtobacterium flaccumfaciens]MBT1606684.1 DEAD/DEAH box helicase [Curtobacterium flaccumfaciens pv. betae]MCS0471676.1 DEAD/DEAH box helicase [Curtobacterium flaccumfaciens pv. betae]MCS0473431.1 DEAD/DEAH box helicase [Curtobacterium flaccumfaciens pv. betae]MCS0477880.1 DEAD/DEAH box helicase [Curtobacterium flaccumfaciens pv. betae]MCS0479807.1 DEAD/DEAH box helicase [Curtobacterium flaccumfaciens pv. betae]